MNYFHVFFQIVFFVISSYKHDDFIFDKYIAMFVTNDIAISNIQNLKSSSKLIVNEMH